MTPRMPHLPRPLAIPLDLANDRNVLAAIARRRSVQAKPRSVADPSATSPAVEIWRGPFRE
jgi:hypothetical protein